MRLPDRPLPGVRARTCRAARCRRLAGSHETLRESEKMYRFSAEIGRRLVWSADGAGEMVAVSRLFHLLAGPPDPTTGRRAWQDAIHPGDRGRVIAEWRRCVETGEPFSCEFRALLPGGEVRSALARAVPWRGADGRVRRWFGSTEDVHGNREIERARREVEERFRLAVRATNDVIWDYDIDAGLVEWSEGGIEAFGYHEPRGPRPRGWWEERVHPDERMRTIAGLANAIEAQESRWASAYRFRRSDGSYADVFDRGFIIRENGRAVRAVGAMTDLSDRYRAEAEIQRMQAELIHVSRVSAMGTMASTLAHELNQPLTALVNYVRGARRMAETEALGLPCELIEAMQAAEAGALRAGAIVRRMRELVARGSVSTAAEDLPTLIDEAGVLAFVDEQFQGVRHTVDVDPAARWVRADRIQIQQVLINLIRNAMQAMEGASRREIRLTAQPAPRDMIEIRVADTGTGIAREHIDHLFSRFATTKRDGMGIGLPISRTIVEAHGGRIWAENDPAGGAVIAFTLPAARRAAP